MPNSARIGIHFLVRMAERNVLPQRRDVLLNEAWQISTCDATAHVALPTISRSKGGGVRRGGVNCRGVVSRPGRRKQSAVVFHNLLFGGPLSSSWRKPAHERDVLAEKFGRRSD